MRRTSNPYHCAVPLAMMLLFGTVRVFFEDCLTEVGYFLCVFFWTSASWVVDLMPKPIPVAARTPSPAHPRFAQPRPRILVPHR